MNRFVVFEGIDGSGKSSLAWNLCKETGWAYTREPTFSSEKADSLNLGSKNDIEREIEFAVDRIEHVYELKKQNGIVICDRYIWSGLTYCSKYNPKAFEFARALYDHDFFPKPDLYVFVDTPVEICHERKKDQPLSHLEDLRNCYLRTQEHIHSEVLVSPSIRSIQEDVDEIKKILLRKF